MSKAAPLSGRITRWNDERGFGFIRPDDGGEDVFVHISAFARRGWRPVNNERVRYQSQTDERGRLRAGRVRFTDRKVFKAVRYAVFVAGSFLAIIAGLTLTDKLPPLLLGLYVGASILAFAVYAWDKSAARNNQWRTEENTLHLLGLLGGWPGALIARHGLRHKSRKRSFIVAFWITVLLNCAATAWLVTPDGQAFWLATITELLR